MYCKNCGAELAEDQIYCLKCGVPTGSGKSFCRVCGNAVSEEAIICVKCGVPLKNKSQENTVNTVGMKKRSVALAIVLSFITCGIYWIYWFISLTNEMNKASGRENETGGGMSFLFTIITCRIYFVVWAYRMCEKRALLLNKKPSKGLWIFLGILSLGNPGFGLIIFGMLQSSLNVAIDNEWVLN